MATQFMAPSSFMAGTPAPGYSGYPGGKNGGFSFRKRVERLDWRKIASVDVDNIARTLDFTTLQDNIMNITFCNLEAEMDVRSIDPNFVKVFKLSQLTIEYLLHSQEYLAGLCMSLEGKAKQSDEEVEKLKKEIETLQKEVAEVKKESHKRKKMLIAQQQLMHVGNESYNKCPFCTKAFLNNSYLQSHIIRRHSAGTNKDGSSSVSPDLGVGSESGRNIVETELTQLKERMMKQEAELQEEKRALLSLKGKHQGAIAAQINQNSSVSREEVEEGEDVGVSAAMMREMKELNAKYQASQRALMELEARTGNRRSYLGNIEDEVENEKEMLKEQRTEVAALKEQLQQQLDQMKEHMQTKLEKQERKWQKKVHHMTQQHASEIKKLNNALETTNRSQDGSQSPELMKQQHAVEELLRQSREREKVLEKQEQQLEKEIVQAAEVKPLKGSNTPRGHTPRGTTPRGTTPRGTTPRGTTPRGQPIKHSSMYPSDDEASAGFGSGTGTSSLRTIGQDTIGGSTFGQTGTQSLHTNQFLEELRKNPTLAVMREQLAELLQEHVEKKGIPPGQTGISDQVLENKLAMLRTQRQTYIKNYPNFLELRDQFNKTATEEAKKKLRSQMASPRGFPPQAKARRRLDLSPGSSRQFPPSPSGPRPGPPHPQQHLSSQRSTPPSRSQPATPTNKPQPQPRSTTPQNRMPLSTGSTTEWTSTQFDSDEDESEDDAPASVGGKAFVPSPGARLIQSGPARGAGGPSPRMQGPKPRLIQSRPVNNNAYDEGDDLLESDEEYGAPIPSQGVASPKRVGGSVQNLARSVEQQLGSRSPKSKPFGGVNVGGVSQVRQQGNVGDFDQESDWDDTTAPDEPMQAVQRRPAVRASTDGSNTYGTSAWGSSSKAASTIKDKDRRSTSRSSFVSVTDVSSDDDMNVDNL